jgi:hypothetical protein
LIKFLSTFLSQQNQRDKETGLGFVVSIDIVTSVTEEQINATTKVGEG